MSRSLVTLRQAEVEDAPVLLELWAEAIRRADPSDQLADLEFIIKNAAESAESTVVVAEYDGQVAGAVLLRVSTVSPINLEQVVQAVSPHVLPQYRRHGIGRTLMECAVSRAEELGIGHIATAASSSSRDGNRFMARLALGPQAVFRIAPTVTVRSKIAAQRPASERVSGGRHVTQVLAARRSLRRSQAGN